MSVRRTTTTLDSDTPSRSAGRTSRRSGLAKKASAGFLLAAATGLFTAGLSAPAQAAAGQAAAAAVVCNFDVNSLTVWDRQEENSDGDEIKFTLAGSWFGPWDYPVDNWERNASLNNPNKNFTGTLEMRLYEIDAVTRTEIDRFTTDCTVGTRDQLLENNDTIYEVNYTVRVV